MEDAVKFLRDPKVKGGGADRKVAFLRGKGLGLFDIEKAAETAGDPAVGKFITDNYDRLKGEARAAAKVPDVMFTLESLQKLDGAEGRDLCISCKGVVYRVDPGFYGTGNSYNAFAGTDCSRHLAKVTIGKTELNQTWEDLTAKQVTVLDDWEDKYRQKYTIMGRIDVAELSAPAPPTEESTAAGKDEAKAPGGGGGCAAQ